MFTLYIGQDRTSYPTKGEAIKAGQNANVDSFEVEDEEGYIVYQEFPQPRWM